MAASRETGRAGEIFSDSDCEQVAGSMHSSPKKAEGLKKTDLWTLLHTVTPTQHVLLCILLAQKCGHRFFQESLLLQYDSDLNAFPGKWQYTCVCRECCCVEKKKKDRERSLSKCFFMAFFYM